MRLYTNLKYANQTLILPTLGTVTLDAEASLEVMNDELALELVAQTNFFVLDKQQLVQLAKSVTKPVVNPNNRRQVFEALLADAGILELQAWLDDAKRQAAVNTSSPFKEQVEVAKATMTPEAIKKAETNDQDEPIDVEMLTEAINDATDDELQQLAVLVPGVKPKAIKKLSTDELRKFLLLKVQEAGAKQVVKT